MTEHSEQAAVIDWRNWNRNSHVALRWLHAIPNGGHRHIGTAVKLQAEGVTPGICDLFLPYPNGEYAGLYIEMKAPGKADNLSEYQLGFIGYALQVGYHVAVCDNADDAIKVIREYLAI